jgi:hypothetical protein
MSDVSEQVINPKTGLYIKNPTRLDITASADNQQDIVNAVVGVKSRTARFTYQYSDIDKSDPPPLSGITKIREMTDEQRLGFFKSLMRFKPNIIKLHVNLGNYAGKRRVNSTKVNMLNSNKPRFHTEVAEKIADVFNDTPNVVELVYTVNLTPNSLIATAEVYSVSDEDYKNDDLFAPAIGLEHLVASN